MNRFSSLTCLLLLSCAAFLAAAPMHAEIRFLRGPLKEAISRAEAEQKPVMIDFITDWCRWCDTLDARTYSDASVADFVNSRVIPIKIDAEKGEGIDIAKKYGVRAYPTILLIRADGEEIDRLLGYMPPEPFKKALGDYLEGVNTISALQAALAKNPSDPGLQYKLASRYAQRNDMKGAAEHYRKMLDLDPADSLKHAEEARFMLASAALSTEKKPDQMVAFVERYPSSPMSRQAMVTLGSFFIRQQDTARARDVVQRYVGKWPDDAASMNNFAWRYAETKMNLDQAAELAHTAVSLAKSDSERAMYLDTEATVEFNRGNADRAITLEQQALDLLKTAAPKERKDYEASMAKFKAAKQ